MVEADLKKTAYFYQMYKWQQLYQNTVIFLYTQNMNFTWNKLGLMKLIRTELFENGLGFGKIMLT